MLSPGAFLSFDGATLGRAVVGDGGGHGHDRGGPDAVARPHVPSLPPNAPGRGRSRPAARSTWDRRPGSRARRGRAPFPPARSPCVPVERLERKRTGSRSSTVGPAVTSTVSPARSPAAPRRARPWPRPRCPRARPGGRARASRRPGIPIPAPPRATPRARRMSRFSRTAGWSNMFTFMAGATITLALVARYSVVSASSAMPRANLPRTLAVAGATSRSWAASARLMCRMSPSAPSANWSRKTGWRDSASNVMGVTNSRRRAASSRRARPRRAAAARAAPRRPCRPRCTP